MCSGSEWRWTAEGERKGEYSNLKDPSLQKYDIATWKKWRDHTFENQIFVAESKAAASKKTISSLESTFTLFVVEMIRLWPRMFCGGLSLVFSFAFNLISDDGPLLLVEMLLFIADFETNGGGPCFANARLGGFAKGIPTGSSGNFLTWKGLYFSCAGCNLVSSTCLFL